LANGAGAYEDWACEATNIIHNLANKFNCSVSQRDDEIKNLLFAICIESRNFTRLQKRTQKKRVREEVNFKYFIILVIFYKL
jgi:hypothetical protein